MSGARKVPPIAHQIKGLAAVSAPMEFYAADDDEIFVLRITSPDCISIPSLAGEVLGGTLTPQSEILPAIGRAIDFALVVIDRGVDDPWILSRVGELHPPGKPFVWHRVRKALRRGPRVVRHIICGPPSPACNTASGVAWMTTHIKQLASHRYLNGFESDLCGIGVA